MDSPVDMFASQKNEAEEVLKRAMAESLKRNADLTAECATALKSVKNLSSNLDSVQYRTLLIETRLDIYHGIGWESEASRKIQVAEQTVVQTEGELAEPAVPMETEVSSPLPTPGQIYREPTTALADVTVTSAPPSPTQSQTESITSKAVAVVRRHRNFVEAGRRGTDQTPKTPPQSTSVSRSELARRRKKTPIKKRFSHYTSDEDRVILDYIKDKMHLVGGRSVWNDLAQTGLVGRTAESLRNRYYSTMVCNKLYMTP